MAPIHARVLWMKPASIALPNAGMWTVPEPVNPSIPLVLMPTQGRVGILLQPIATACDSEEVALPGGTVVLGPRCCALLLPTSIDVAEVEICPEPDISGLSLEIVCLRALLDAFLARFEALPGHDKLAALAHGLEGDDNFGDKLDRLADLLLTSPSKRLQFLLEGNVANRVAQLTDRLNSLMAADTLRVVKASPTDSSFYASVDFAMTPDGEVAKDTSADTAWYLDATADDENLLRRVMGNLPPAVGSTAVAVIRGLLLEDTDAATRRLSLVDRFPWEKTSPSSYSASEILERMSRNHIGHLTPKKLLSEIALRTAFARERGTTPSERAILLVGAPGIGKTSLAAEFATATGRKFQQISMSQVDERVSLIGSAPQYFDSGPGQILNAIVTSGVRDPVICLDEIDRIGARGSGADPSSVLLTILDDSMGGCFKDAFLGVPVDLSAVTWICTANSVEHIDSALLDRFEVVPMGEPSFLEMIEITGRALIPRAIAAFGLRTEEVCVEEDGIIAIVTSVGNCRSARLVQARIRRVLTCVIDDITNGAERVQLDHEYVQMCRWHSNSM